MTKAIIITNKVNPLVDPSLQIWGWEVSVYLFLGGLTAGILIITSLMILKNKGEEYTLSTNRLSCTAPIFLAFGMLLLFLDLEHKLYVWRFYTTFHITSPISWGAWILILVFPLNILMILSTFRDGFPKIFHWLETNVRHSRSGKHLGQFHKIFTFSERHIKLIAKMTLPVGVMLGIYTGIFLSTFGARPFWNSPLLGPIFLVSGISTAAALIQLLSKSQREKELFTKSDIGLILTEISLLVLLIIGMLTSPAEHLKAVKLILGGELTHYFWILLVGAGLFLPLLLEFFELKGVKIPSFFAAMFVLFGGLIMRFIMVEAGQVSAWISY